MTERDAAILAARRRGFTQRAIASGLGITHQAVSQRLQRYEPIKVPVRALERAGRRPFACPRCGKQMWLLPHDPREFCSMRCFGNSKRRLSEDAVKWAIEMRVAGAMTWTTIAKKVGFPMQTVQTRIWRYLYFNDCLTLEVIRSIWRPTTSENRTPSWRWVENMTGLSVK